MITTKHINELYRRYRNKPLNIEERNLPLLAHYALDSAAMHLDGSQVILNKIDSTSPFRTIDVDRIHAVVDFDNSIAIVLRASIVFIHKLTYQTRIHIRPNPEGLLANLRYIFEK